MSEKITYKDAGVDVELADRVIGSVVDRIRSTFRPEVIGKFGGFAALVKPEWRCYEDPVLVSATDGVGTKLKIAFLMEIHDTVGIDLVAMSANDVLVSGASPLFFLDYLATGAIDADTVLAVISGIAEGCQQAGCSLVGGETAEMPDFYAAGEYDLAGFCVGIVDRPRIPDSSTMRPGDVVLALPSSGLHSNGYSLVRKVLLERKGYRIDTKVAELGKTLGEELLIPTTIYVQPVLDLLDLAAVSGIAHITGGGFQANIPRVLSESCAVAIDRTSWEIPPIFDVIRREAGLDDDEMFRTFNMGVGLVVILPPGQTDEALKLLRNHGVNAWIIGEVKERIADGEPVIFA